MREWIENNGRWYQERDNGVTVVVSLTSRGAEYSFFHDGPAPVLTGIVGSIEMAKYQADSLEWQP